MRKNKYGEDIHLVQVYFPLELLGKMKEQAKRHKRSLNKQILWLLEQRIENTAETLSFDAAQQSWFKYSDKSYPVASAPTPIFKAALLQKVPHEWVTNKEGIS